MLCLSAEMSNKTEKIFGKNNMGYKSSMRGEASETSSISFFN